MADKKFVDQYLYYHNGKEWKDASTISTDKRDFYDDNGFYLGNINNIFFDMALPLRAGNEEEQTTTKVEVLKRDAKPNKKGEYKPKDYETINEIVRGPIKIVKTVGEQRGNMGEVFSRYVSTTLGDGRVVVGRYHTDEKRNAAYQIFDKPHCAFHLYDSDRQQLFHHQVLLRHNERKLRPYFHVVHQQS